MSGMFWISLKLHDSKMGLIIGHLAGKILIVFKKDDVVKSGSTGWIGAWNFVYRSAVPGIGRIILRTACSINDLYLYHFQLAFFL